ncbi:MAG: hypothetical protein P1U56_25105 [Saprospiraceae bacterium]|nr:hypothetical protein [Saprospiraceae bacterium]
MVYPTESLSKKSAYIVSITFLFFTLISFSSFAQVATPLYNVNGTFKHNGNGEMICLLSTQDNDKGPKYSNKFKMSYCSKVKIEYWKAKTFGVHTHVGTEYIDLETLKDYDTSFY